MAFRCAITGEALPPGTRATKVVLAVRPVVHPARQGIGRRRLGGKWRRIDDRGGQGLEIAREVLVGPEGLARLNGHVPAVLEPRPITKSRLARIEEELWGETGRAEYDARGRRVAATPHNGGA